MASDRRTQQMSPNCFYLGDKVLVNGHLAEIVGINYNARKPFRIKYLEGRYAGTGVFNARKGEIER